MFSMGWLPAEEETLVSFFVLQGFSRHMENRPGTLTTVQTVLDPKMPKNNISNLFFYSEYKSYICINYKTKQYANIKHAANY